MVYFHPLPQLASTSKVLALARERRASRWSEGLLGIFILGKNVS